MKLGFVYIVKNEESTIGNSLNSIKEVADEIVIVDTGSTDKTKEIAKTYTDKVYDYVWEDDFSKARNFSIDKSESEWLLWLDADEELDKLGVDCIKKWKKQVETGGVYSDLQVNLDVKCYRLPLVNYVQDKPQNMFWTIKLFKRALRFERPIHEGLNVERGEDIGKLPATILHYGYNRVDEVSKKKRFERNLALLLKQRETDSGKYNTFHLGSTYYYIKDYENAIKYFKELTDTISDKPAPYEIEAVTYSAEGLYQLKRYDEAVNMAKLLKKIEPCNIKAYYIKALSLAHKKNFEKAIDEMGDGLQFLQNTKPHQVSTYNYVDYSFANWSSQMGVIFNLKGDYMKALVCYKTSLEHDPSNVVIQRNILKQLYAMGKKYEFMDLYKKWNTPDVPSQMVTEMLLK